MDWWEQPGATGCFDWSNAQPVGGYPPCWPHGGSRTIFVLQFHLKFLKVNIKHFHVEKNVSTAWGWLFHPTLLLSLDGTLLPNGELQ
jgi:hypothetical protein